MITIPGSELGRVAGAALNAEMLSRLKHGALLINTSRGRLVDTVAATEALTKD